MRTLRRLLEHKALVFVLCCLPLGLIAFDAWHGHLSADPIKEAEHRTGDWTLRLLMIVLAISPLVGLSKWNWPRHARRMVGLFAFFYGCVHMLIWLGFDQEAFFGSLQWLELKKDLLDRKYITVGMAGLLGMVPLAATSSNRAIRWLGGDRWRAVHRLVYLSAGCGVIHYYWLVKASHVRPLGYAALFAALMAYRGFDRLFGVRAVRRRGAPAGVSADSPPPAP